MNARDELPELPEPADEAFLFGQWEVSPIFTADQMRAYALAAIASARAEALEGAIAACESETIIQHGEFGAGWVEGAKACIALIRALASAPLSTGEEKN